MIVDPFTAPRTDQQRQEPKLESMMDFASATTTTTTDDVRMEPNQVQVVESLVSSLADKKRTDLDYLSKYLKHAQQQQQSPRPFFVESPLKRSDELKKFPTRAKINATPPPVQVPTSWKIVRCVAVDIPLMLLFLSLAMVYFMRVCWTEYYLPIMERARRTDDQLLEEYTYYERACTSEDVTHGFKVNTINSTAQEAMDTLLLHGATTVPQLLTPGTIAKLRQYLRHKNSIITDEEAIPMSQPYRRVSYAIEATEDEAVSMALSEITSHPWLLQLLEQVLGVPDPALTEITAITAFYGARDQVIHSDTKSEGYAAQFARTYTHTYSLFIPVQPITAKMGVTQLCPGTHYCTNDLQEVCEKHMFGVNRIFDDDVWQAGDGVLLNQQVWHGGSSVSQVCSSPVQFWRLVGCIATPTLYLPAKPANQFIH
jgi:hypothetical protein